MRIGYFADGPWSHKALEKLVADDRFEITFIVPRFDTQDPILKNWADKLTVDYLLIENVNHPDSIAKIKEYDADLNISMSFNQILKKPLLEVAPLGFINCHAGKLPYYRGRNILNWALINDEKEFGVTVHYIDEGIDTGDIIIQRETEITDLDDYSTLLSRAIDLCAESLFDAVEKIESETVTRTCQSSIHSVGFYCGRRIEGDEWIDWNWSSSQLFNFIRAITEPGPCARSRLADQFLIVKRASMIENAPTYLGTPGEVVGFENDALIVKTGDSTLRLDAYILTSSYTNMVSEKQQIKIGSRFAANLNSLILELGDRINMLEQSIK